MGFVKNGNPSDAGVGGFPDATTRSAHIVGFGIVSNAGDSGDAATAVGADEAPGKSVKKIGRQLLGKHRESEREREKDKTSDKTEHRMKAIRLERWRHSLKKRSVT